MNQTEMDDIVRIECKKHPLCNEEGICPFYEKGKCLMIRIRKIGKDSET